jgi:DNA-binding MarR family transcriptional regulator
VSVDASAWAWAQPVSGNRKLVLLALADHADREGVCWPGLRGLADKCGIGERAVKAHTQALEVAGYLKRERRRGERGAYRSNLYRLSLTRGTVVPEAQPRPGRDDVQTTGTEVPQARGTVVPLYREPSVVESSGEPSVPPDPLADEFTDWLAHHEQVTGMRPPGPTTKARAARFSEFRERRAEGISTEDLKLATLGAFNDEFRQERHLYGLKSVLRPTMVHDLVEKGRKARGPTAEERQARERRQRRAQDRRSASADGRCVDCGCGLEEMSLAEARGQCDECFQRESGRAA